MITNMAVSVQDESLDDSARNPQPEECQAKITRKINHMCDDYLKLSGRITLLVLTTIGSILSAIMIPVFYYQIQNTQHKGGGLTLFVFSILMLLTCIGGLGICCVGFLYMKIITYVAPILWMLSLIITLLTTALTHCNVTPIMYALILLLYISVPMHMIGVIVCGFVALILNVVLTANRLLESNQHEYSIIGIELCFLLSVNLVGFFIRFTLDRFYRRTFFQTYDDLKSRIELEEERQRQEQLLLSIIPHDLAHQMRQSMLTRLTEESRTPGVATRRLWHDFYVREHKQVSILFADLVNFTQLTTKCSAKDLVGMLNEIYGRFDNLARHNDCMRIKTLGDCYCCVSGMPVSRPKHAINVVRTGLQMVQAIKTIREMTTSRLDMRIGIHSGNVLCGVLGTVKWKYDIWSEDVTFANFLESTGVPGRIHISRETMLELDDAFSLEKVTPPVMSSSGEKLETYLIRHQNFSTQAERRASFQRSRSVNSNSSTQQLYSYLQSWGAPKPFENITHENSDENTIPVRSYEMLEASADSAFHSQLNLRDVCSRRSAFHMRWLTLQPIGRHNRDITEKAFRKLKALSALRLSAIGMLHYVIISAAIILMDTGEFVSYAPLGISLLYLPFLIYFAWEKKQNKKNKAEVKRYSVVGYNVLLTFTVITHLAFLIILHYVLVSKSPIAEISNNTASFLQEKASHHHNMFMFVANGDLAVILPVFLFIYASFLLKLVIVSPILLVVLCLTFLREAKLYFDDSHLHTRLDPYTVYVIPPTLFILTTGVLIIAFRQYERSTKALILWKTQFSVENVEVETMKNLTKLLLTNILPQHVAFHYLEKSGGSDLYHESYENVCIIFASVVNFDDFFKLSSDNDKQHQCLRLLNEIIGDFDMLLNKPKYSVIEKMKTVGSTYMAASGLQPGKDMSGNRPNAARRTTEQFVQVMTDFALSLFAVLDNINKHSFNNFRLRIGMSHGPVIAGVVGAQKPQYDVWGDTVNMASRMESGGVVDHIQMTENTGNILLSLGFPCQCRGKISVKGKADLVTTYLLRPSSSTLTAD